MSKKILMIAGPNGAGKTTMSLELISDRTLLYEFLNADEIARGLAPLHPETVTLTASKLLIKRLKELLEANRNFAFETTASGTNYVKYLQMAKQKKYAIHIVFLWLSNPQEAIKRVSQRVKQGGHFVEKEVIERRYYLGIKNFINFYLPLANTALILDNSLEGPVRKVIARKKADSVIILDKITWKEIQEVAHGR